MNIRTVSKDQSGAALVIALIMIVVLTLIGLASTFSSTFEISLSGNKRLSTNAFYDAETHTTEAALRARAIDADAQVGKPNDYIKSTQDFGDDHDTVLTPAEIKMDLGGNRIDRKTVVDTKKLSGALDDKATLNLYHTRVAGGGGEGRYTLANGYIIDTQGTDNVVSSDKNRAKVHIRMQIVVHSPTPEESQ